MDPYGEMFEVPADDPARVADAIDRAARGAWSHLVRDGHRIADIVPTPAHPPLAHGAGSAGRPAEADLPVTVPAAPDPGVDLSTREARMADRDPRSIRAGIEHAARFGAPTLAHYYRTYRAAGAAWPGEDFVRRHYPVADHFENRR